MQINFTSQIWRENNMYVSYNPELDISSCGKSVDEARRNLKEAVELFLEEAEKMGTLKEILEEAGFEKENKKVWKAPEIISIEKTQLAF